METIRLKGVITETLVDIVILNGLLYNTISLLVLSKCIRRTPLGVCGKRKTSPLVEDDVRSNQEHLPDVED